MALLGATFVSVITYIGYILLAIAVLLMMVTIHELGHYTAGKILKFKINEFSIGFGKAIFSKTNKKTGEKFSIRIFPLGGYCAFEGEDEDKPDNPDAFNNQKPWKRLIVTVAGATFNLLAGFIFSFIFLVAYGYQDVVKVDSMREDATGITELRQGDVIVKVNGTKCNFVYDNYFNNLISKVDSTDDITLTVKRNGKTMDITVNKSLSAIYIGGLNATAIGNSLIDMKVGDQILAINGEAINEDYETFESLYNAIGSEDIFNMTLARSGVSEPINVEVKKSYFETTRSYLLGITTSPYVYSFWEALGYAIPFTVFWAWKVLIILFNLIIGKVALTSVGGPIATISIMATATRASFANFFLLLPLLSANLAAFNLLPFPSLDGARSVFIIIEWIRGKPINRKVEGYIHTIGLFALLAFIVVVDILYLFIH